jgi:hypothetical protein
MIRSATFLLFSFALACGGSSNGVDVDASDSPTATSHAGEACLPENVPPGGFSATEVYLETSFPLCTTRVCMVYQLEGDPRTVGCDAGTCVTEQELHDHVYCTCRCSAPSPAELCTCPSGFVCVDDLVTIGGTGVLGGYCVRN